MGRTFFLFLLRLGNRVHLMVCLCALISHLVLCFLQNNSYIRIQREISTKIPLQDTPSCGIQIRWQTSLCFVLKLENSYVGDTVYVEDSCAHYLIPGVCGTINCWQWHASIWSVMTFMQWKKEEYAFKPVIAVTLQNSYLLTHKKYFGSSSFSMNDF